MQADCKTTPASAQTTYKSEPDRGARHPRGHIFRAHHSLGIAYCSASDTEAACAVRASMGESHGLGARTELRWGWGGGGTISYVCTFPQGVKGSPEYLKVV